MIFGGYCVCVKTFVESNDTANESERLYNFGEPVTHDTYLRLHWKKIGTYYIQYNAVVVQSGQELAGTIDGGDSSEELFAGHKVTMVNVWATWCPPCVAEMPDLEKLSASLAEKDCQIIGICKDANREETLAEANRILDEAGVSFTNLVFSSDMLFANISIYPSTFFIAEDGTILTEPVEGANMYAYNNTLGKALAQVG